jgi:WD40 repeat protein
VRNWIPSTGLFEDDFERGLEELVAAIETDLDWVRAHTHWGGRAEEWRASDHDRSFLLRGAELSAAERWIADQEGKDPPPTRLQGEYILASRRATTRRQRLTLTATGTALVVAIGLAIFALIQRNEAISQRDQALSRSLAASARDNLRVDPELSTLLALEAVKTRETPEAEASLRQALGNWRLRLLIHDHGPPLWRGAVSPDGRLIATGDRDSQVQVWKADTGEHIRTFHGRGRLTALGFSRDGDRVVAVPAICATCPPYVNAWKASGASAWDVATGERVATGRDAARSLEDGPGTADFGRVATWPSQQPDRLPVRDGTGRLVVTLHGRFAGDVGQPVAQSPDGSLIALGDDRPGVWDANSGRLLVDLHNDLPASGGSPGTYLFGDVEFSPDGALLAAMGQSNVVVLNPANGEQVATLPNSGLAFGTVTFSPDGSQLLTVPARGPVGLWDPTTGESLASLEGSTGRVRSAVFSPDGSRVLTTSVDGTVRSWEAAPAGLTLDTPRPSVAAAFSPRGDRAATADRSGATYLVDAANGERIAALGRTKRYPPSQYSDSFVRLPNLRFNPGGSLLVGSAAGGEARVWTAESGEPVATLGAGATADAIPVPGDKRVLIVEEKPYGTVEVWDIRSERLERRVTTGPEFGPTAAVSPNGRRLATFGSSGMIWNLEGDPLLDRPMTGAGGRIVYAKFSPDGGRLVTVDRQGPVRLWNVESGRQIWEVESEALGQLPVSFSDDGSLLTNGREVWEAATGERVTTLASGGSASRAVFSPDGKLVLTTGGGRTLLWDARTGEPLYIWHEGESVIADDLFSVDGTQVLATGPDATHLYACEVCGSLDDLVALAEQRVTRELTDEERAAYGID